MAKQSKKDDKVKLKDVLEVTCWLGIAILAIVFGCPYCHKRKYHLTLDMVVKAPRYTNDGKGTRTYTCDACGHSDKEEYIISRLRKWSLDGFLSFIVFAATMKNTGNDDDNDYSSGGGYSNSSSGGGFSGGSSGGGGASSG